MRRLSATDTCGEARARVRAGWRRVGSGAALLLLGLVLAGAVAPRPAAAQQGVVQCQKCHADRAFLVGKGPTLKADSALFVPEELLRDSKHAKLSCTECHPVYGGGYPHPDTGVIAVPCESCHEAEGREWERSIHAPNAVTEGDAPTCVTCHGSHHVLGADDPRSPTYALNVASTCGSCHADPRIIETYFNTPEEAEARSAVREYHQTVHGTAVTKAGLVVAATCNDCHGAHEILPPDSARSTVNRANIAQTCGACHAGVLETFEQSSHGEALRLGDTTTTGHPAPVCTDCHVAHKIVRASDPRWFRGVVEECGACHEHLYETYFETYHGQVTGLGYGLTAKCSDCHTAHAMLPPTDPRSSVNQANLVETCAQCHPKANANFVKYLPHGDPRDRQTYPGLFWVWLFMTTLLVGVFGFFGAHTLLWIARLTVNALRGRPLKPSGATAAEPDSNLTGADGSAPTEES